MRIVVDTNVWVSAFQFPNPESAASKAAMFAFASDVIATCDEIEAELKRILVGKFLWDETHYISFLQRFLHRSVRVTLEHNIHVCRDPKDNMFLECAQKANADLIVAGDKDLLVLGSFSGAKIVTPAQYLQLPR